MTPTRAICTMMAGMAEEPAELRDDAQQLLRELEQLLKSTLRDNALAAVAVAAAAGFIAGVLLTRSGRRK
jgi:ElaB/YqjD/DUF883 family membrane-anchored ribosome-binding protein